MKLEGRMKDTISVVGGDAANALLASTVTIQHQQEEEEAAVSHPHPPPPHRRGRLRVREISSRFMSPLVVSNSNPTAATEPQRSKSVQQQELEPYSSFCADENFPETAGSFDSSSSGTSTPHQHHSTKSATHKKQRQQQRVKPSFSLNKENDVGSGTKSELQQSRSSGRGAASSRPDTPIVTTTGADRDRIVPSRYRLASASQNFPHHRPSAAGKLLHEATKYTTAVPLINYSITETKQLNDVDDTTIVLVQNNVSRISKSIDHHSFHHPCTSASAASPHQGNNRNRILSDMRSSMPEVDHLLPTCRWHAQTGFNNDHTNSKFTASPCSRSLNFPQLNGQNSNSSSLLPHTTGHGHDHDLTVASSTPTKTLLKNNQVGGLYLPPHPSSLKLGAAGARKGRKLLFNHQEDLHSLKLLYNYYLQWRFTNAKAEASMVSQKMDAERQLYSLGIKMSEMRDGVKRKRIELEMLQRTHTSSTIAESQMPYLDEWSALEEDYSTSLPGVIDALLNLSLRLPISGGVKLQVSVTELEETLDSAEKVIEMIVSRIESFMVKAEEIENLTSEIARVMGGERAHIHDCGDSLLKLYASQVEECSLRGLLIQLCGHKNRHQKKRSSWPAPLNPKI